jgi:hypothetical protein
MLAGEGDGDDSGGTRFAPASVRVVRHVAVVVPPSERTEAPRRPSARDAPAHDVLETIATMCVRASADLVAVARLLAAVDGQPRGTAPAREV